VKALSVLVVSARLPVLCFRQGIERLGGMGIILVEQRYAGLIAGGIRWNKRQLGKKTFPGRIASSDLFELDQVGAPNEGILMDAIEVRFVPEASSF
jgi:hypothetical protein